MAVAALALAGCGADSGASDGPVVVATTPILASLASEVVGDNAEVRTLLPDGADPHDYQPSARDAAQLTDATLIVANGEGFEEGLRESLESARSDGVPVFTATEHVALGGSDAVDPHIFTDPDRMAGVVLAMGDALAEQGVEARSGAERAAARLRALDLRIGNAVAAIPDERREIVTGHESLGYYADRYGFDVVGTVIPNLSTSARVSAADVADVTEIIDATGVLAIFAEPDTAPEISEAIADETGARVVTIHTESFGPGAESYEDYLTQLTDAIVTGLRREELSSTG